MKVQLWKNVSYKIHHSSSSPLLTPPDHYIEDISQSIKNTGYPCDISQVSSFVFSPGSDNRSSPGNQTEVKHNNKKAASYFCSKQTQSFLTDGQSELYSVQPSSDGLLHNVHQFPEHFLNMQPPGSATNNTKTKLNLESNSLTTISWKTTRPLKKSANLSNLSASTSQSLNKDNMDQLHSPHIKVDSQSEKFVKHSKFDNLPSIECNISVGFGAQNKCHIK